MHASSSIASRVCFVLKPLAQYSRMSCRCCADIAMSAYRQRSTPPAPQNYIIRKSASSCHHPAISRFRGGGTCRFHTLAALKRRACAGGTWQRCRAKGGGGGAPRLREGLGAGLRHAIHTMVPASRSAPRSAPPARTLCASGGRVCCGPGRGAGRHAGPAGDCARASG